MNLMGDDVAEDILPLAGVIEPAVEEAITRVGHGGSRLITPHLPRAAVKFVRSY